MLSLYFAELLLTAQRCLWHVSHDRPPFKIHIKSDSKSFYAYVRSKQNVRDRVGPLEDNAGNIITQGVLMAEELNMHFSSVFTREDISSLPAPETKFEGSEGKGWGS